MKKDWLKVKEEKKEIQRKLFNLKQTEHFWIIYNARNEKLAGEKREKKPKIEDRRRITKNNNKLKKDSIWSFSGTFERLWIYN